MIDLSQINVSRLTLPRARKLVQELIGEVVQLRQALADQQERPAPALTERILGALAQLDTYGDGVIRIPELRQALRDVSKEDLDDALIQLASEKGKRRLELQPANDPKLVNAALAVRRGKQLCWFIVRHGRAA